MRTFVQRLKTAMVTLLGTCAGLGTAASRSVGEWTVYVGTFTTGADEGIYLFRMDAASGTLSAVGTAPAGPNPAFLAIHPNGRFLYAVNEVREFEGAPSGSLRAFSIDSQTGRLSPINAQPTAGESPCYTTVERPIMPADPFRCTPSVRTAAWGR